MIQVWVTTNRFLRYEYAQMAGQSLVPCPAKVEYAVTAYRGRERVAGT